MKKVQSSAWTRARLCGGYVVPCLELEYVYTCPARRLSSASSGITGEVNLFSP